MTTARILGVLALAIASDGQVNAQTSTITPLPPYPPTQLQSGVTPYNSYPLQGATVSLGPSGVYSGVTSIRPNPLAEETPVRAGSFSLGGRGYVPGADTATQSSNSTNSTNATGGRGFSNRR